MSLDEAAPQASQPSQDAERAGSPAGPDQGLPHVAGKKRSSVEVLGQPSPSSTGKLPGSSSGLKGEIHIAA